jgi:hypothetical protein
MGTVTPSRTQIGARVQHRELLTSTIFLPVVFFNGWLRFPLWMEVLRNLTRKSYGRRFMRRCVAWMGGRLWRWLWCHCITMHGKLEWPADWQRAYFMPLFKGDGSQLDPDNYRQLAISSVVVKLFEKILDRRIQVWERVGLLSDLQGGFRTGRGTVDQLFVLNEIRRERSLATFVCFIDVS